MLYRFNQVIHCMLSLFTFWAACIFSSICIMQLNESLLSLSLSLSLFNVHSLKKCVHLINFMCHTYVCICIYITVNSLTCTHTHRDRERDTLTYFNELCHLTQPQAIHIHMKSAIQNARSAVHPVPRPLPSCLSDCCPQQSLRQAVFVVLLVLLPADRVGVDCSSLSSGCCGGGCDSVGLARTLCGGRGVVGIGVAYCGGVIRQGITWTMHAAQQRIKLNTKFNFI